MTLGENPMANLFTTGTEPEREEIFETLLETDRFRLERIISTGQATPAGIWYDQERHEWVALLSGKAGLLIEGEREPRVMKPGDHVVIPARCRHRVEWTDPDRETVWLALHY
jgi:cupin 2 domain-containing protein